MERSASLATWVRGPRVRSVDFIKLGICRCYATVCDIATEPCHRPGGSCQGARYKVQGGDRDRENSRESSHLPGKVASMDLTWLFVGISTPFDRFMGLS